MKIIQATETVTLSLLSITTQDYMFTKKRALFGETTGEQVRCIQDLVLDFCPGIGIVKVETDTDNDHILNTLYYACVNGSLGLLN